MHDIWKVELFNQVCYLVVIVTVFFFNLKGLKSLNIEIMTRLTLGQN